MDEKNRYDWTPAQCMAARAITLIRNGLYPNCDGCGYSADRPNCAMDFGGGCPRHDQENVIVTDAAIEAIEKAANFPREFDHRWDLYMPLHLYNDFSDEEKKILLDLADAGGKVTSRTYDKRFLPLMKKRVVSLSCIHNRDTITISDRGLDLVKHIRSEHADF